MDKNIILLISLILILFILNYSFIDNTLERFFLNYEYVKVERVIDGDTVVAGNNSIRLLGINSPERGELYYNEAKEFLEELVLDEEVRLEFGKEKYDRYNRILAYLYINNKNVNLELVKEGFANVYILDDRMHERKLRQAWEDCIKKNKNLCEKSASKCAECVELREFDYENEIVVLHNRCEIDCDLTGWEIKDEGRKKFIFPEFVLWKGEEVKIEVGEGIDNENVLFWGGEDYVWTDTGDTLFLRDGTANLILYKSY